MTCFDGPKCKRSWKMSHQWQVTFWRLKIKFRFSKKTTQIWRSLPLDFYILEYVKLVGRLNYCGFPELLKNRPLTMNSFNSRFFFSGWSLNDDSQSTHLIIGIDKNLSKLSKQQRKFGKTLRFDEIFFEINRVVWFLSVTARYWSTNWVEWLSCANAPGQAGKA